MARAANTDPFQNFRFHVYDTAGGKLDRAAGFTTATTPNITVTSVEYREGVYTWTRKFPGVPTVGDLVLNQGIFKSTTSFFNWILEVVEGGNRDYRSELVIDQYHITDEFGIEGTPSRRTLCKECFPIDVKPTGDFGGDDDAVQITEASFSVEEIEVINLSTTSTPLPNFTP